MSGFKPVKKSDGSYLGPVVPHSMVDRRHTPTLREGIHLGVMKAQCGVVDANYDFRNFRVVDTGS